MKKILAVDDDVGILDAVDILLTDNNFIVKKQVSGKLFRKLLKLLLLT